MNTMDLDALTMDNNVAENLSTEAIVEPNKEVEKQIIIPPKDRRNGKEEKSRKKDDRSIELVLKSLSGLVTSEEKLSAICKKYVEVNDENRKLQAALKQSEKQILSILKEKDQCQSEKSKAVLARSRLENLCRELQRQNKAVKEESLLKIREEEEKRKEVSAKFQSTLAEITALMAETNEKNVKLHEDNIEIHKKFKSVFDEMDIREQHFEGMHQMMKQELQLAEAKLAKVTLEMSSEKETLLKERNQLLLKLAEYQTKIFELQTIEANLRSQVDLYVGKYDEFQSALSKSNEVFGGFNEEMEKMSKKILKLEKETHLWKTRWEKSQGALLEMATDKQARDIELANINKKCSLLQELCKAFQQERATLLTQLKESTGKLNLIDQNSAQDNQKLIDSIENNSKNLMNGSDTSNKADSKIEKKTKDVKTESTVPVTNTNASKVVQEESKQFPETNVNLSNETKENVCNQTVNINNEENTEKCLLTPEKPKESQENSSELKNEEKIIQVPNNVQEVKKMETINFEETKNSAETLNKDSHAVILNTSDTSNSIQESQVGELPQKMEKLAMKETQNNSKVENQNKNLDSSISNEDNCAVKKNKDGKKKKKS